MKNKIYQIKLALFLLVFAVTGCQDVLDVIPTDKVSIDRLLNKYESVQGFRENCYSELSNSFLYSGETLEAYTDDAFTAGTGTAYDWHNGLLSQSKSMFANGIWNACWKGIRKCNNAIKYIPQSTVPKDKLDDETIALWTAEAKTLRAWYHLVLIQNFGPIPFTDNAFSPGFDGWTEIKRPSFDEISNRIVKECDEIIEQGALPFTWETNDLVRMNMAFVYALKSRVLLYNASKLNNPSGDVAKWQSAATAAQSCIDVITKDDMYQLLNIASYNDLFSTSNIIFTPEIIFRSAVNESKQLNENNGVDLQALGSPKQSKNCGAVPTQELIDCFELTDGTLPIAAYANDKHTAVTLGNGYTESAGAAIYSNRDKRFKYAIVANGSNYGRYTGQSQDSEDLVIYTYDSKTGTGYNPNFTSQVEEDKRRSCTGYYTGKFRSASYWSSSPGGTNAHKIFFRLAEIYLNLAEAQCEAGNLDAAIAALNVIRTRAEQPNIENVAGYTKSKEFLLARIRNERRVELCFEGHRFYDQRRWDILEETNGAITGMKITSSDGTDEGTFSYERVAIDIPRVATTDNYLLLPLTTEEARRLPGLAE